MLTLVDVLKRTEGYFRQRGIASPRLDAELLIGQALGLGRVQLYMNFDMPLEDKDLEGLRAMVRRRGDREPVAYILGSKGFYEHEFKVVPGVLCPRPDTEVLVEAVLELVPESGDFFLADVGCGTGCIGLSVAAARPGVKVYATDISDAALRCTRENVAAMELGQRVAVLKGSFLDPVPAERRIDVVVSNPPYIPKADLDKLEPEVREHEPREALEGGLDGLDAYRALIPAAARRAAVAVAVEVGDGQASAVEELMRREGLSGIERRRDLAGKERAVLGFSGSM